MSVFIFYEKTNSHQSAEKNNLSPHLAATLLLRQPCNTATLLSWPLYSGPIKSSVSHFLIQRICLIHMATPLMWPYFCGPLLAGLMGFHCPVDL